MHTIGTLAMGTVIFCNLLVKDLAGIIVTTLLFGFLSGVFVALPPVLFIALTEDKSRIGTRIGMGLAIAGLGVLAGGPGAGAILKRNDWRDLWIFAGTAALCSGTIFTILRYWKSGKTVTTNV